MRDIGTVSREEAERLIAKLTEREIEALALVASHKSSKEISIRVKIGIPAVDARIKNATRKLGVDDRRKAAEIYDIAMGLTPGSAPKPIGQPPYGLPPYQSPELVGGTEPYRIEEPDVLGVSDFYVDYQIERRTAAVPATDVAMPSEGGARNQLDAFQRVTRIAAIAIGMVVALGGMISAMNGLVQIVTARGQFL